MVVKDKGHRPAALNPEATFIVLYRITSLQYFDPIVIAYFFVIVVIAFSNTKPETNVFNTNFYGLKTAISYG